MVVGRICGIRDRTRLINANLRSDRVDILASQPQVAIDVRAPEVPRQLTARISVIVPACNSTLHLPRCLDALARSEYLQFEVIVVDDCSTDDTASIGERYGARCLRTPQRMGPAGARNLGAQAAGGEILLFVDADVVVPPGTLRLVAEDFVRDPELAAVFGSYDDQPAWQSFISQYKNLMHHYVHQTSSELATTFWAGCGAMRKAVFEEFRGFDAETYFTPSIEDIALGLKLTQSGRRIKLDKRIEVKHLKRWTVQNLLRADILYRAIPWTQVDPKFAPTSTRPEPYVCFTGQFPAGRAAGHRLPAVAFQPRRPGAPAGCAFACGDGVDCADARLPQPRCVSLLCAQAWMVVCRARRAGPLGLLSVQRNYLHRLSGDACSSSASVVHPQGERAERLSMRIGVDATSWSNRRGYGRYTRALMHAVLELDQRNQYIFFVDFENDGDFPLPSGVQVCRVSTSAPAVKAASADSRRSLADMWAVATAMRRAKVDVVYFPTDYTYVPFFIGAPRLVTIHDAIAEMFPKLVFPTARAKFFYRAKVRSRDTSGSIADHGLRVFAPPIGGEAGNLA